MSALVALFERLGGELRLSTPVDRITVQSETRGKTVHDVYDMQGGKERFDLVVSHADIHHTYATLYRDNSGGQSMRRKLERMDWSMSLFVMYFGTKRRYPD